MLTNHLVMCDVELFGIRWQSWFLKAAQKEHASWSSVGRTVLWNDIF